MQSRLGGATYALIKSELQCAVRDFYLRSLAWRATVGPYQLFVNKEYVFLNPVDAYANVQHVLDVYIQTEPEKRKNLGKLTSPPIVKNPGEPTEFFCAEPTTLQLSPVPNTDLGRSLYVRAALVPTPNTERLPDIAVSHHYEAILNLALARMYIMPHKPWTSLELAGAHERRGNRLVNVWKDEANRGNTHTDTAWRFPPFA
jgi:hypothetical protein